VEFRIADTFTDSLARLGGEEQKAVKTTAFDLQINPSQPGMQFHKLDKAKDPNFWSIRVSRDLRLIVHRTGSSLLLCYVNHHDEAYLWAERRKLEVHPKTGAAQLVEIRETVQEIKIPKYVEVAEPRKPKPFLFSGVSDDQLLGYGVPAEWLADVRKASEDSLLEIAAHLPDEAAEALLSLATGTKPSAPKPAAPSGNPFEHPDAQRRFRVMSNQEELERALDYPWEKWTIFLHPEQRQLVERDYNGPAKVAGSAGTGKTIVALHRAVWLARRDPEARVLLTTFSDPLANSLAYKLRRLIGNEPRLGERLEVHSIGSIARHLYGLNFGAPRIADSATIASLITAAAAGAGVNRFSPSFLVGEWEHVVDAWQLESWEAYRDVGRLGRKTRLPENQRKALWTIFEKVLAEVKARGLVTMSGVFSRLASHYAGAKPPFEFVVVDEAQDVEVAQLRFLAALGGNRPNALFFAGDLGQRIFQQAFSWKALGVDIRGRSTTLRVNYRTSHQIRSRADQLLAPKVADVDGNVEERKGTTSVFNGPPPEIREFKNAYEEQGAVASWLAARTQDGVGVGEIGVFVRSAAEMERAKSAAGQAGLSFRVLDDLSQPISGAISLGTMHLAKGLEFRAVAVMACDGEIIPSQQRIESVSDEADLEEVYDTERHLLYVACTRARDYLLVTGVEPASEFLQDME
jgi:hypothetical protein